MATNSLVKAAVGRYAKNSSLAQQQNQVSIAETDPHLLAARAEAEAARKKHWWSKKAEAEIILSERDRKVLRSVKRRAYYLDRGFKCCCFNVGLDGVIGKRLCDSPQLNLCQLSKTNRLHVATTTGLIPGIGDALGAAFALELIRKASKADLPYNVLSMMMFNVMFDFAIGLVPILGDVLDFMYKANIKNAVLLEEYLMTRRRDELLKEQGKLPPSYEAGTGPVPGTSSATPAFLADEPRITAYDSDDDQVVNHDRPLIGQPSSPPPLPLPATQPDAKPKKSYRTFWK
ncbi:hypothetical protein INT43_006622 [Umbelopsis isabellina]|uniref:DUF4112 domain-containing protein n=1 Tax=Mortierella isabellina TaxID=91625 RepID=A0A8H7PZI9_MORIS|nr:hypothetical protein INT43_006622 [Umbelopsis isabellina]